MIWEIPVFKIMLMFVLLISFLDSFYLMEVKYFYKLQASANRFIYIGILKNLYTWCIFISNLLYLFQPRMYWDHLQWLNAESTGERGTLHWEGFCDLGKFA